jgi:hypothetical protein
MPLSLPKFIWAYVAYAFTSLCSVCLMTGLKSAYRSDCIDNTTPSSSRALFEASSATLVFALSTLVFNALLQLLKPRSKSAWAVAVRIFQNWQPSYFIIVSCQRIILTALLIEDAARDGTASCALPPSHLRLLLAALIAWNIALLLIGMSAILFDLTEDCTAALRRSAYVLFAICCFLDSIGAVVWGNTMAPLVSISIGSFRFTLDEQITSSNASQTLISIYFLVQSFRSSSGRAWAFAPLRFELNAITLTETSLQHFAPRPALLLAHVDLPSSSVDAHATSADRPQFDSDTNASASQPAFASDTVYPQIEERPGFISRLRYRWIQFQSRQIARCHVFVIPCVSSQHSSAAAGSYECVELTRPLLQLPLLRLLHAFADAHANLYIAVITLLGLGSFMCQTLLGTNDQKGQACLVLNSAAFVLSLGFISSKRYALDKVAAKQIMFSFRFVIVSLFLAAMIALGSFLSHRGITSPWQTSAGAVFALIFLICVLLDCSPNLPAFAQTCISVAPCP